MFLTFSSLSAFTYLCFCSIEGLLRRSHKGQSSLLLVGKRQFIRSPNNKLLELSKDADPSLKCNFRFNAEECFIGRNQSIILNIRSGRPHCYTGVWYTGHFLTNKYIHHASRRWIREVAVRPSLATFPYCFYMQQINQNWLKKTISITTGGYKENGRNNYSWIKKVWD